MKRITQASLIVMALMSLSACSVLPDNYQDHFSCHLPDNNGKCISVDKAYKEAVTGVSQGKPMRPASEEGKEDKTKSVPATDEQASAVKQAAQVQSDYATYRRDVYQELSHEIHATEHPIMHRAHLRRTLILSYSLDPDKEVLYMPRYIYTIDQRNQFVLSQYLFDADPDLKSIEHFMSHSTK